MLALTIKQPWAEFILAGLKKLDNRVWRASHKGVLLIHASKKFDETWYEQFDSIRGLQEARAFIDRRTVGSFGKIHWRTGAIVGAVIMTGCDMNHNDPWCKYGCWYHRYAYPRRFKPIECAGRMKLFQPKVSREAFDKRDIKQIEELKRISKEIYKFEEVIE